MVNDSLDDLPSESRREVVAAVPCCYRCGRRHRRGFGQIGWTPLGRDGTRRWSGGLMGWRGVLRPLPPSARVHQRRGHL